VAGPWLVAMLKVTTLIKQTISQLYALAQGETSPPVIDALATGSLEALLVLLDDTLLDPRIHAEVCWMLGQLGDKRAASRVMARFSASPARLVWWEAAKALALIGSKRVVRPLIAALGAGDNERRGAAIHALSGLGDQRAVEPLLAILSDPHDDPAVRGHAAEALAQFADQRDAIVPRLIRALDDGSPEVRFWAAFALGQQADEQALPALRRIAETDSAELPGWWSVRQEAADAIASIGRRKSGDEPATLTF
jgi:HEAT repeat protein